MLAIELKQPNSFLANQWDQSRTCKVLPKLFLVPLIAFYHLEHYKNRYTLSKLGYTALRTPHST